MTLFWDLPSLLCHLPVLETKKPRQHQTLEPPSWINTEIHCWITCSQALYPNPRKVVQTTGSPTQISTRPLEQAVKSKCTLILSRNYWRSGISLSLFFGYNYLLPTRDHLCQDSCSLGSDARSVSSCWCASADLSENTGNGLKIDHTLKRLISYQGKSLLFTKVPSRCYKTLLIPKIFIPTRQDKSLGTLWCYRHLLAKRRPSWRPS